MGGQGAEGRKAGVWEAGGLGNRKTYTPSPTPPLTIVASTAPTLRPTPPWWEHAPRLPMDGECQPSRQVVGPTKNEPAIRRTKNTTIAVTIGCSLSLANIPPAHRQPLPKTILATHANSVDWRQLAHLTLLLSAAGRLSRMNS